MNPSSAPLKWKWKLKENIKWFSFYITPFTSIGILLGLTVAAACVFIVCHRWVSHESTWYDLSLAMTTGIAASSVVTIFLELMNNKSWNMKRWHRLTDYFAAISRYLLTREMMRKVSIEDVEENGMNHETAAWAEALEEWSRSGDNGRNFAAADPARVAAVAGAMSDIEKMCGSVTENSADLLRLREYGVIKGILSNIDMIRSQIEIQLCQEEAARQFAVELRGDLHEDFDDCEDGYADDEKLRRFRKLLEFYSVENVDALVDQAHTIKDIAAVQEKIWELFDGYEEKSPDGEEESEPEQEGEDHFPYPQLVHPEEFEEPEPKFYENPNLKRFRKQKKLEYIASGRFREQAEEFTWDFLSVPEEIDLINRQMIAVNLLEIDEAMLELARLVKHEPGYGMLIEMKK